MFFNNLEDEKKENCCIPRISNNWTINKNCPNIINALQVQLQGESEETIANGANVIYDTVILNATTNNAITYDNTTGIFTINERGTYHISWWTNANGAKEATNIIFAAESGATSIAASSVTPLVTLQLNGQALFNITSTPATLSLVNRTGNTVFLGQSPVQADLTIIKL